MLLTKPKISSVPMLHVQSPESRVLCIYPLTDSVHHLWYELKVAYVHILLSTLSSLPLCEVGQTERLQWAQWTLEFGLPKSTFCAHHYSTLVLLSEIKRS